MTILQLKYVIGIANSASMREASSRMFVSQPALSMAIQELEKELNVQIFKRTNKGIQLTDAGSEFLVFAKKAVGQYRLIEDKYLSDSQNRKFFSVSIQHYIFAVHAFINTIRTISEDRYNYSLNETRTDEVIDDVRSLKSEIGVVSYSNDNEALMKKLFREYNILFHPLCVRNTYVYLWKDHPLAGSKELSITQLSDYPCISFNQDNDTEYYLSEEALATYDFPKLIKSKDRAASLEMIIGLDGFAIGTGIMIDGKALADGFKCVKLKEEDPLTIGYITRKGHELSDLGRTYIDELHKYRQLFNNRN